MKFYKDGGGIWFSANGILILAKVDESKDVSEDDANIVLSSRLNGGLAKKNDKVYISGEGEWELSNILICGYKGETGYFYLLNDGNVVTLFVNNALDIDDAFRKIPLDIDVFIIPVELETTIENLKKRVDSIDTGAVIFATRDTGSLPETIKEVSRGKEISEVDKVQVDDAIRDKKSFYFLKSTKK